MKTRNPNLVMAETVAHGILWRIYHHPEMPIYQGDVQALEMCSEAFRIGLRNIKRRKEGGCEFLQRMILGLGNKKLGLERKSELLPESFKQEIINGVGNGDGEGREEIRPQGETG